MSLSPRKVLVVAQTPPPYHGQAIMTEYFLNGEYKELKLIHLRMAFSESMEQVGQAGLRKIWHLLILIFRIWQIYRKERPDILYYPPASPNMVPFLRDSVLLIATRRFFPKTIFHFHAGGLEALYRRLPSILKKVFWWAYDHPDLSISVAKVGLQDGEFLHARKTVLVPNGIPDEWRDRPLERVQSTRHRPQILFLSMVCEEKGVGILLEACLLLQGRGIDFQCKIAGQAPSELEEATLKKKAKGLGDRVEFVGKVTGEAKWALFAESNIFCFPNYYPFETFGVVVIEAMMAGLPVVASDWRALPEIIQDGETGILVPTKDIKATAQALEQLLAHPEERQRMGQAGRRRYEAEYQVETYQRRLAEALERV